MALPPKKRGPPRRCRMLEITRSRMPGAVRPGVLFAAAALAAVLSGAAGAEPLPEARVPEPLRPWIEWALHGHEEQRCPFLHGAPDAPAFVWPARLDLQLGARQ